MRLRPIVVFLAALWLAGCELLPQQPFGGGVRPEVATLSSGCGRELPDFAHEACLLEEWIAFGLASQRGDRAWREATLAALEGASAERRLARAVALGWGSERQWDQAAELYRAELAAAPAVLQPLLRYWYNELEGRRALVRREQGVRGELAALRHEREVLEAENAELLEKLEALADIERRINLRQQTD